MAAPCSSSLHRRLDEKSAFLVLLHRTPYLARQSVAPRSSSPPAGRSSWRYTDHRSHRGEKRSATWEESATWKRERRAASSGGEALLSSDFSPLYSIQTYRVLSLLSKQASRSKVCRKKDLITRRCKLREAFTRGTHPLTSACCLLQLSFHCASSPQGIKMLDSF